jgi:hypothetical protein
MWLYALACLGEHDVAYREKGIRVAKDVHRPFVLPGRGVIWKMEEDLSAPYPGYGLGAMDAFDGYVSYKLLGEDQLASEIADMRTIMERQYETVEIDQDLGLGMMLWLAHFFPREEYDREAIIWLMACCAHFPGAFVAEKAAAEAESA